MIRWSGKTSTTLERFVNKNSSILVTGRLPHQIDIEIPQDFATCSNRTDKSSAIFSFCRSCVADDRIASICRVSSASCSQRDQG